MKLRSNIFLSSFVVAVGWSSAGCGGGSAPTGALVAPSNLTATLVGTSANLTWTDSTTNESGFEIERYTATGGWAVQFTTGANVTAASSTNLEPGTAYSFRVRAINGSGKSDFTNEAPLTVAGLDQPNRNPTAPYNPNFLAELTNKNKWAATTVTYFVDNGAETRDAATIAALAERAAARWNTATNGLVTLNRVGSSAGANIVLSFVSPSDPDVAGSDEGSASYTFSSTSGNRNILTSASVKVKAGVSEGQLVPLLAHEFGHALGIGGHSSEATDTMNSVVTASTLISVRDANTVAKLYLTAD